MAPLDWGLGHATRCIPIIRQLLDLGYEVWLAGEGAVANLLQEEFPGLPLLALPGYRVRYAASARGLAWKLLRQLPRLRRVIGQEHAWLQRMVAEYGFAAVVSDNRYGLWHPKIPSILITHQLALQNPRARWTEKWIRKIIYRHIGRFGACWVPDSAEGPGLAGALSHPQQKPETSLFYIGCLSRLRKEEGTAETNDVLILLSGPEPQRGLLEEIILRDIAHYPGPITLVRGLPGESRLIPSTNLIHVFNHLPAGELNKLIGRAGLVIARSGYSTLMDLVALGKKSLLIPTPGQTEQEYLARHFEKEQWAPCLEQKDFDLAKAIETSRRFNYRLPLHPQDARLLNDAIRSCLPSATG